MINTRLIPVDPAQPDADVIAMAAALIREGKLVAFPTETVYGLGANATDETAVARIFVAKQRPTTDPIIVHIADKADLDRVAVDIPSTARLLADRFWAGALTIVLKRGANIPPNISAGMPTVAVRMPSHPVAQALIKAAGVPIGAPSANTFSRPSATTAQHVIADLFGRIDLVLDGGATTIGLESTVIDLTGDVATVLRPGGVTLEALRDVLPEVDVKTRYLGEDQAAASPGEMLKHYSPKARLMLYDGNPLTVIPRMIDDITQEAVIGNRVGVLTVNEEADQFQAVGVETVSLGSREDMAQIGLSLFAGLRELDARRVDVIFVRGYGREGLGAAIWDRLIRAAEGRIIRVDEKN